MLVQDEALVVLSLIVWLISELSIRQALVTSSEESERCQQSLAADKNVE
ncbi:hypothetical protein [Gilvimarinus japonicus]|jgi:hypothetical protein|uniref:Uncharacterized protein n=1 Tax=Gilvimarinus japonicus TaxID=1796469 RepID=A0ABV7HPT8_9GAMM